MEQIFIIILATLLFISKGNDCGIPYQRCICSSGSPYCQCSYITSQSTFNYSSSYVSHLVLVGGLGCHPCAPACLSCASPTHCLNCNEQYELTNGECSPCPINCKSCESGICQQCLDGYYIDSKSQCRTCPLEGTLSCTIDSLKLCTQDYWLDNNGARCVKCDDNCQICSSTSRCAQCVHGYYLSMFTCIPCSSSCATCTSSTICTSCAQPNHYYNSTLSLCVSCDDTCIKCVSQQQCVECAEGYALWDGGLCLNISNVVECVAYENGQCVKCASGYYVADGLCVYGCSVMCGQCRGAHYGMCEICREGTVMVNLNCLPEYNIEGGSAYQLYYTASNNPNKFDGGQVLPIISCFPEIMKGGTHTVTVSLQNLQAYKLTLQWKVYAYGDASQNRQFTLIFNNSNHTLSYTYPLSNSIPSCDMNVQKGTTHIISNILTHNTLQFTSNSLIGITELLVIGYRCGGTEGASCGQCSEINYCTKCVNQQHFKLDQGCVSACPSTYYVQMTSRRCYQVCPYGTYSSEFSVYCEVCRQGCSGCSSESSCFACEDGYYLYEADAVCVMECPARFFPDSIRAMCESCVHPCFQCLNSHECLSCSYGFYHEGTCITLCPDTYYPHYQSVSCVVCPQPCLTCQSPGNVCLSCVDGFSFYAGQCVEVCPIGYYVYNQTCTLCDEECASCVSEWECTSCRNGFLYNYTCLLSCPIGYYNHVFTSTCLPCPQNCTICFSAEACVGCLEGWMYLTEQWACVSECPSTYYEQDGACVKCVPPCDECVDTEICVSCVDAFLFVDDCVSQCPLGFYPEVSELLCASCQSPCSTCDQFPHACTSCLDNYYLYHQQCLFDCGSGLYADDGLCLSCSLDCKQCVSSISCVECAEGLYLHGQLCVWECPNSYYPSNSTCVGCGQKCSTCVDEYECTQCVIGWVLNDGICGDGCGSGEYVMGSRCEQCMSPCQECVNQVQCTSCEVGYLLDGICYGVCPDGYYGYNQSCVQCEGHCLRCVGSRCLHCEDGYYYSLGGSCVAGDSCPLSYFPNSLTNQCQSCFSLCIHCEGSANNCTQCIGQAYLLHNTCALRCPLSHYVMQDECLQCRQGCAECSGQNDCLSCQSSYLLYRSTNSTICVEECPTHYYDGSIQCIACSYPCDECVSETECLSCVVGLYFEGECYDECPTGSYLLNGTCLQCQEGCLQCDAQHCYSCGVGSLYDGQCVQLCPLGYYPNYGICSPCIYGCSDCNDGHSCNVCQIGFLYQQQCISYCPIQTVSNNNTCQSCTNNCLQCMSTPSQCISCHSPYYLYLNSCVMDCPEGTYASKDIGVCITCTRPCQTCTNAYSCESCIYGYILYKESNKNQCVEGPSCPNSYYLAQEEQVCEYECEEQEYKEPVGRTCSQVCAVGWVHWNMMCLSECPEGMWVDSQRVCRPGERDDLPVWSCAVSQVRNLLTFLCETGASMHNLHQLAVSQFYTVPSLTIEEIIVDGDQTFRLITSQGGAENITNSWIQIHITPPYEIQSSEGERLQNRENQLFIDIFHFYTFSQRQSGLFLMQVSQSICWVALAVWFFAFLRNKKLSSLLGISSLQFLYSLCLSANHYPPNVNQFLEGFRPSLFLASSTQTPRDRIWTVSSVLKDELAPVISFHVWIYGIIGMIGAFILLFLGVWLGEKLIKCLQVEQSSYIFRLDRKLAIIRRRFKYNYIHHLTFLLVIPISLFFFCQTAFPSLIGFLLSAVLFILLLFILIQSCFLQPQSDEERSSYRMLFAVGLENMLLGLLVVWSSLGILVAMTVVFTLGNYGLWIWVQGQSNWRTCFCALLDGCRLAIVSLVLVGELKVEDWHRDTMYAFGWIIVVVVFLYALLLAIFSAKDFFQTPPKSSSPSSHYPQSQLGAPILDPSQEQLPEQEQEESFFQSERPPSNQDTFDDDFIDFSSDSESVQRNPPPKQLIKINKQVEAQI